MLKFLATIKNIDFSITNEKSGTALSFAHSKGHQEAVELIIEKGGNPNFSDGNGNTLLMFAANRNQVDFVKFLISKGADISAVNKLNKDALWFAYSKQNKEVMKIFLLDENVKPVVIDSQKNSIVVLKVDGNKIITLKEFPIKAKASASDTPLTLACKAGKIDAIDYLLENEFARTNEADDQGNTALIYAVKSSLKAMNLLIQHEVNIDQVNNLGKSALWFAQNSNNQDAEKLLLASGAATKGANVDSIVRSFNSNPIKFVLDYHTKIKPAVEALEHLGILHKHSDKMAVYLDKTIECLDKKSTADCKKTNCDKDYGDQLYGICGKDGFKYSDYSDYSDSEL